MLENSAEYNWRRRGERQFPDLLCLAVPRRAQRLLQPAQKAGFAMTGFLEEEQRPALSLSCDTV